MTFDDVFAYTSTVSAEPAFRSDECHAFFDAAITLEPNSTIVEIGCEFGRSTSILAQIAAVKNHHLIIVDPFVTNVAEEPWMSVMRVLGKYRCKTTLMMQRHQDVSPSLIPYAVNMIHVDGDHSPESLRFDCKRLLWRLLPKGIAAFHDYGRSSLPHVREIVDDYTSDWEHISLTHTLKILRKHETK